MAKGQYLSSHQQGIVKRYYQHADTRLADKLGQIVSDIYLERDPAKVAALWKSAHELLKKTPVDQMRVGRIIAERNAEALAKLLGDVALGWEGAAPRPGAAPTPAAAPVAANPAPAPAAPAATPPSAEALSPETLKSALAAFKKRLKVTRLDAESKLGSKYVTGGRNSGIVGITPPNQFPRPVWDELVKQGKLKYAGSGLYELVGD